MYAEICLAKATSVPASAGNGNVSLFTIEFLYPEYATSTSDTPASLELTEGDDADCLWTWDGSCSVGTYLVVGRLVTGDWIVISEAC